MPVAHLAQSGPRQNYLLSALPDNDFQNLLQELQPVQLEVGQTVHEAGPVSHAWFPASCVLSLQYVTSHGATIEVASIGDEGMAGVDAVMSDDHFQHPVVVRAAGIAYRLPVQTLITEFRRCPTLQAVTLRYLHSLLAQVMQAAACNRHHSIEQQLCRCLLSSLDRQPDSDIRLTQEFIANTLGVRRESITEAARKLQQAGVIHYRRGHITVDDRRALEAEACECYGVVRREVERMQQDGRIAA